MRMGTTSATGHVIQVMGLSACLAAGGATMTAAAVTASDADLLFQAHAAAFYRVREGRAWFRETTQGGKTSFWMRAEQMEMVLDTYERTRNPHLLEMFEALHRGFVADHGPDWSDNDFNDDIMWMVIACARAYQLTGTPAYLHSARTNFDLCFARAWSDDLGGGLWWKTDNQSKNACVNGPAAIAACLLAQGTGDATYREKAERIYAWERATLVDASTGQVYDNIRRSGRIDKRSFSYNQGTFVGAAHLLGDTESALRAATWAMNRLGRGGILPGYGESGDGGGFNGICVRWIARFLKDHGEHPELDAWLRRNAEAAWTVRRTSDNLSWCHWDQATPDGKRYSWGCSGSVVMLQVIPHEPVHD